MRHDDDEAVPDSALDGLRRRLIETARGVRLPELATGDPSGALYLQPERHGVRVVALRTTSLRTEQLDALLRFLLGQYAHPSCCAVDVFALYQASLEHEVLLDDVSPGDIHLIAIGSGPGGGRSVVSDGRDDRSSPAPPRPPHSAAPATGEVLAYAVLWEPGETLPNTPLRLWERPLFPVEKAHGWGIFNRLQVLPDTPMDQVRELRHFVVNHELSPLDERRTRAQAELGVALTRTLVRALRGDVTAVIGDDPAAREMLAFLHVPTVAIHGTLPYAGRNSYFAPRYEAEPICPFAFLEADIARVTLSRVKRIEDALELPGNQGPLELFRLKSELPSLRSTLAPPEILGALTETPPSRSEGQPAVRRQILDLAERLRTIDLFVSLSDAEARILANHLEQRAVAEGDLIVRQGQIGEELFLVESGQAEARVTGRDGTTLRVNLLGAGDHFGEIALVTGGRRTADVIALSPMTLLVLSKATYERYLTRLVEVEQEMNRTAASRASETVRQIFSQED